MIKLVLMDTRPESPAKRAINEFFLGTNGPLLVQVPNLVYHGWKCIYVDPDEYRLGPHATLPYDWARRDG